MHPSDESLRAALNQFYETFQVQFSGCQIFQQMHPFAIIRQHYGDCNVCLVRLHSTQLLVDKVYSEYTSIIIRPFFRPGFPWLPPLLEIVDGLGENWERQVALYILQSTKPVLVVMESVVFPEEAAIHSRRIRRILGHLLELSV